MLQCRLRCNIVLFILAVVGALHICKNGRKLKLIEVLDIGVPVFVAVYVEGADHKLNGALADIVRQFLLNCRKLFAFVGRVLERRNFFFYVGIGFVQIVRFVVQNLFEVFRRIVFTG